MTKWKFEKSYKYEALTLLNILTEDPYLNELYPEEKKYWSEKIDKNIKKDIEKIYSEIKGKGKQIVSAILSYYLSTIECNDSETIIDVLKNRKDELYKNAEEIENLNDNNWKYIENIIPNLIRYFKFLDDNKFSDYLKKNIFSSIEDEINKNEKYFIDNPMDIIGELTELLGKPFDEEIILYVVHFSRPHAIRLSKNSLITIADKPIELSVYIAVHEMIHTPYKINKIIRNYFEELSSDSFFNMKFLNRNKNYGYNTISDYFDENATRAADHYISSKFNIFSNIEEYVSGDFRKRFRKQDDGMHILSPIIFYYLNRDFSKFPGYYQDFLEKLIIDKKITAGNIEREYFQIMG